MTPGEPKTYLARSYQTRGMLHDRCDRIVALEYIYYYSIRRIRSCTLRLNGLHIFASNWEVVVIPIVHCPFKLLIRKKQLYRQLMIVRKVEVT